MKRIVKFFAAIACLILGGFISGYAYTTTMNPHWLGSFIFVFGVALSGLSITYLLIKGINKLTNSSDETK